MKRYLKILLAVLFFLLLVIVAVDLQRSWRKPIEKSRVSYGLNFSPQVFGQTGLDWKNSYTRLLNEYNFSWVRVAFYWNQMVDENGNYHLDDLWFQLNEAEKRNVKVVLVIGAKAPYYPEIYLPEIYTKTMKFGEKISQQSEAGQKLLELEKDLVPKLATSLAITYWQVENEPFSGPVNNWTIDEGLLAKEIELVRSLDPQKRPIILTHPGPYIFDRKWQQLTKLLANKDIFGVNYFPKTRTPDIVTIHLFGKNFKINWPDFINLPVYIWGPISPDFGKVASEVSKNGNSLWIMEMQAEPYLTQFSQEKGKIFVFGPKDIIASDLQIRKYVIDHIGLWGANWWLLEEKRGNNEWLKTVEETVGRKASN